MADQYGHHLPDEFRQLMTHFPLNPPQGAGSSAESYFFHSRNNVALPLLPHHHHQQQQHDTTIMVGEVVQLPGGGLLRFGGHDRDHHHHHHHHHHTSNTSTPAVSTNTGGTSNIRQQQQHVQQQLNINGGVEMESGIWSFGNESGGAGGGDNNSRWPRQETLTLLEIRSRLDSKFKEANHKKPLWDEVSRIMAEEYGYYRSEKKCREKFENLYKYYKKTKDGKAGRQDGKHYRFFRQLEALYGETSNNHNNQISATESHPHDNHHQNTSTLLYQNPNNQLENQEINQEALDNIHDDHHHQKLSTDQSLSVSNTSEFETASSENNIDHHHDHDDDLSAIAFMMNQKSRERQKRVTINESRSSDTRKIKKSWKVKVENFVDSQMRKVMESQEAWMERMLKTIEDREQDRLFKEEKWRKQEMARFDREHEFWAKERDRIEARDAAIMEAFQIFTGRSGQNDDHMINSNIWTEPETSSLIQIISSLEPQFQEDIWEEISAKMASLGYYKSAIECKEKWENMQMYFSLANKKHMKQSTLESMDLINEEKKFWEKGKNKQV